MNGQTSLHYACWKGHLSNAEFLIKRGVSVNVQDDSGNTPLHYVSEYGHVSIVDLLLKNGADDSIKNIMGETARDVAGNSCDNKEKKKETTSFWDQVSSAQ